VKENLDIEKLFKDKFENFEADVNSNLWNNIANGVQSSAVTTTGLSIGIKSVIVASVITVVGVSTYYLRGFNQAESNTQETEFIYLNNKNNLTVDKSNQSKKTSTTIIAQDNDPIIDTHEEEIVNELNKHQNRVKPIKEKTHVVDNTGTIPSVNDVDISSSNTDDITTVLKEDDKSEENLTINDKQTNTSKTEKVLEKNVVYPSGKIEFNTTDDKFEYQFNANAINNEKIIWHFGDGKSSSVENPTHNYSSPGKYEISLTVISKDNEVFQEHQTIEIKSTSSIDNIPNVITPNQDRINDEFIIKTTNIDEFNIVINDQNGNVVFESKDKDFAWDGTNLSGERVENGIYIYYIFAKGTDNSVFKIPGQIYVR